MIHRAKDACALQCAREPGKRVWAYDLPAAEGGAPKRYLAATVADFERAYAALPAARQNAYEVIDHARRCWPFFDLDFARGSALNDGVGGDALTRAVVDAAVGELAAAVAADASDRPDHRLEIEVVVLASPRT